MPKPRRLSGREAAILQQFGFRVAAEEGSHVKLRRTTTAGVRQMLVVPNHRELKSGTVRGIAKQAARYIDEELVRRHFFVD